LSKQPTLGILATILVVLVSLGFISLFSFPTFATWVSFFTICMIPMQIVVGVTWGGNPAFASAQKQPVKGVVLILCALVVGAIVALISFETIGGGVSPPTPMLAMCTIVSVVVTFWLAIMWGGWPFTAMIKNPIGAGLVMLVVCYLLNYLLFRIFFNYGFMQGAPVYVPSLDPHGMFNAWSALVFYVTAIAVMFLVLCFDLWPMTSSPAIMKQPVLGIVWTIIALVLGALAYYIGVNVVGMDPAAFMVRVPIPFIFGTIIVLNMLQGSLFAKYKQPVKGILNTIAVIIVGNGLALMYSALAPVITGKVNPGPPSYDFEIWLASALLAVTFPFLIFYAEFFKMWPLHKAE
jgi:hypothetical protein